MGKGNGLFYLLKILLTNDKEAVYTYGNRFIEKVIPGDGFLNYGLWDKPGKEPSTRLGDYFLEKAELTPDMKVLNVGVGLGGQDILCREKYGVMNITGLDINKNNIAIAQKRVKAMGYSDEITYIRGSAVQFPGNLPVPFDRVLALESPDEFPSRYQFFFEACKALKSKGRIVVGDIFLLRKPETKKEKKSCHQFGKAFKLTAPCYTQQNFIDDLQKAGFKNIRIFSIGKKVFPQMTSYIFDHGNEIKKLARRMGYPKIYIAFMRNHIELVKKTYNCGILEYAIVSARKP